jgi:NADH-quinone oxidoreductase subunit N
MIPDFALLMPELFLLLWAILVFVIDLFFLKGRKDILAYVSLLGLAITLALICLVPEGRTFGNSFISDGFAFFYKIVFVASTMIAVASSGSLTSRLQYNRGEYYGLILLTTVGMMFLSSAGEMISLYVALELTTIGLFILAAYRKNTVESAEAGLKYLILGAISSAILLYGMSLTYGVTGTTDLAQIRDVLQMKLGRGLIKAAWDVHVLGMVMIIAGLSFKLAVVPFHMWAPDVYQGAPTPITSYLSVASKAAGLAALVRILIGAFGVDAFMDDWGIVIAVLAALAMIVGNITAVLQSDIKRMLAYSSIAQAGYILVGLVAMSSYVSFTNTRPWDLGVSSMSFYIFGYMFANMGAFAVAIAFSHHYGSDKIKDYAGLARKSPVLAATMSIFLLSLAGIPPMVGFLAKYYVFASVIAAGGYLWLVLIGVLTSVIALFYYTSIIRQMYFIEPATEEKVRVSPLLYVTIAVTAFCTIIIGCYPQPFVSLAEKAASVFGG